MMEVLTAFGILFVAYQVLRLILGDGNHTLALAVIATLTLPWWGPLALVLLLSGAH